VAARGYDFGAVHAAMRRYVDADLLPGVSWAVLVGRELADLQCVGWADKERGVELRSDHLFRVFSNTKLVTSCAVLLLHEEGRSLEAAAAELRRSPEAVRKLYSRAVFALSERLGGS